MNALFHNKEELIRLGRLAHAECYPPLSQIIDLKLVGSYCYNYSRPASDIDLLVLCDFKHLIPKRILKRFNIDGKKIIYTFRDYNSYNETISNWGPYTLPLLSLLTGELTLYDKHSILEYITKKQLMFPTYYLNRIYTDFYGSGINLKDEIEQIIKK